MLHICNNISVKKEIVIDIRAVEEINGFNEEVQIKIVANLEILARDGLLKEPFAKRINKNLFEIRVKHTGQYRAIYAYVYKTKVIVLSAFQKKTQKTPKKEIKKAEKRLQEYL